MAWIGSADGCDARSRHAPRRRTRSSARSAPAGWARCIARATRGSTARSRSRSCRAERVRGSGAAQPIRARGQDHCGPDPSRTSARCMTSGARLRDRRRSGGRVPRDGTPRRRDAGVAPREGADGDRRGACLRDADRGRARRRAPRGSRPSRPETGQRDADANRREQVRRASRQAARLRSGEAARRPATSPAGREPAPTRRDRAGHREGTDSRDPSVHGARTARGPADRCRAPTSSRSARSSSRW